MIIEETKEGDVKNTTTDNVVFEGVDENMELDENDKQELMRFETVKQGKESNDIEFDKIKISDVSGVTRYLIQETFDVLRDQVN